MTRSNEKQQLIKNKQQKNHKSTILQCKKLLIRFSKLLEKKQIFLVSPLYLVVTSCYLAVTSRYLLVTPRYLLATSSYLLVTSGDFSLFLVTYLFHFLLWTIKTMFIFYFSWKCRYNCQEWMFFSAIVELLLLLYSTSMVHLNTSKHLPGNDESTLLKGFFQRWLGLCKGSLHSSRYMM